MARLRRAAGGDHWPPVSSSWPASAPPRPPRPPPPRPPQCPRDPPPPTLTPGPGQT